MTITMARRATRSSRRASSTEWLELLATDGPFLAAPVVKEAWPNGLPALDRDMVGRLRDASGLLDASPGTRDAFIHHVLADFLGWQQHLASSGNVAPMLTTPVPEHHTDVRPDFALGAPSDDPTTKPLLLGLVTDPGVHATAKPLPGTPGAGTWNASAADRLAYALRAQKVTLGIVTDGSEWTLVCAPPGGATATATWTRHTWFDEPDTLKAFHALLGRLRFYGVDDTETLPALLAASLQRQEEITERLSEQSQAVVEMLVATIGRLDADHRNQHGTPLLPAHVEPAEVYQAGVSVLMRLVFLLYAEERGLLPLDDDTYASSYAASTLAEQLREHANDVGEDTLERSSAAWHRLLATFRAVHRGARHDQLNLPGYGGSLFDPDRYPWLEGRAAADDPLHNCQPLKVDDRTMLRALEALQWLRFVGERRRVSFRVLDVEQIGYVYEGLLDQDARRADDWTLGITGGNKGEKNGPEIGLSDLQSHLAAGVADFAAWLSPLTKEGGTKRTPAAITKALIQDTGAEADSAWPSVLEACGGDQHVARAILPFAGLLRHDPRDLPVIYAPGTLYLTDSEFRAHTGGVYTPRLLAESVVENALEPLVYAPGRLDTENRSEWKIRTPEQILDLKVLDIAAGSGAFLVSATRYLADRLIDAQREHQPRSETTPVDDEQQVIDARRRILDHCIYGVDVNPMAVEMARLSLWLVTLDRLRPFGFLDDRLAVGDSLLGLTSTDQLLNLHLDPQAGGRLHHDALPLWAPDIPALFKQAVDLRGQIAEIDLIDSHDAEHKARLLAKAQSTTEFLTTIADALAGASLAGGRDCDYLRVAELADAVTVATTDATKADAWRRLDEEARFNLTNSSGKARHPAHFPLLFPEVFGEPRSGFDAVIGNPPFLGNRHWKSAFDSNFQSLAARLLGVASVGKIDLAVLFLRRAWLNLANNGNLGIILTTAVRDPEAQELGLDWLISNSGVIYRAISGMAWPTQSANVRVSLIWATRRSVAGQKFLDGEQVENIAGTLTTDVTLEPAKLDWLYVFQGVDNSKGECFLLSATDERLTNYQLEAPDIWLPYLTGEDIAASANPQPQRYCLYTGDRALAEIEAAGPQTRAFLAQTVQPARSPETLRPYRGLNSRWWQMWNTRATLRERLKGSAETCLAIPAVSKYLLVARMPSKWVATNKVRVAEDLGDWLYAIMLSQWFESWIWRFSGRLDMRINVSVASAVRTFPKLRLDNTWATDWLHDWQGLLSSLDSSCSYTGFWNLYHASGTASVAVKARAMRTALDARIASENALPTFTNDFVKLDVGQRFKWSAASSNLAVKALFNLNLEQSINKARTDTKRQRSSRNQFDVRGTRL